MFRLFSKSQPEPELFTYLIAGFGNPGREYANTRHNVGLLVIDKLCQKLGVSMGKLQSNALTATAKDSKFRIILAKPQTYMNLSGQAVSGLLRFYKIPTEQLLVIHDDLDLPFGTLRIRPTGGSAGQKGLGSTIERLGSNDFARIRVGIGRPPGRMEAADYVLHPFQKSETQLLETVLESAAEAALTFVREGLEPAMNHFNGPVEKS